MAVDVPREAADLARFEAELQRRLEQVGVRGLADLQRRDPGDPALATVSRDELDAAIARTGRLVDALTEMLATLDRLGALGMRRTTQR